VITILQKWNFNTSEYEPYTTPADKTIVLYTIDMDLLINCTSCFKDMTFGQGYTSRTLHNHFGLGYPVCEDCYEQEWEDEKEAKQKIKPTGKILNMWERNGWGNSINWSDFEKRRIVGHITPMIRVGDEVRSKMDSGKTARFIVKEVERMRDPNDMLFAIVEDYIGYVEDESIEIKEK